MAIGANTVRTQIVDKNNKVTHVHKNADNSPLRSGGLPPVAKAATMYSGYEILQRPPVILDEEERYDLTIEDGVERGTEIVYADIYRHEDNEDGQPVYYASGYSDYDNPKVWLVEHIFGITDSDEQSDFVTANFGTIDTFLKREFGASEIEWTDDLEYRVMWGFEMNEPISVDEAFDRWEDTKATDYFNESDPGTFGVRNMWAAMGEEINAVKKASESSVGDLAGFAQDKYRNDENIALLRAVAFDGRLNGTASDLVAAQQDLVSNPVTPADAILEVASKNDSETVQFAAVQSGRLSDSALETIKSKSSHVSVKNAVDKIINKNIMDGFGA